MDLSDLEWKEFFVEKIYNDPKRGKRLKKEDHIEGDIPYVSSSSFNNGVDSFIGNEHNVRKYKDCLSLANSGSVGSCFYEPFEFIASDHITHLKGEYTPQQYLFMAGMLNRLAEKYNFNREINDMRISREKIMLPVDESGNPDFKFMEQYVKKIEKEKMKKYLIYCKKALASLDDVILLKPFSEIEWKPYIIGRIAKVDSGRDIYDAERVDGDLPYITAGVQNNGIGYFVGNINNTITKNAISVSRNGAGVGSSFYHEYPALYSNDCRKVVLNDYSENKFVSLFITNQIMIQRKNYNYSRKMGTERLKKQKIMLPAIDEENPDYEYMEQYIKNIMIKKYKDYIAYAEK